jgi:hypothetical protein
MARQLPRLPPNFAQMPDRDELLQRYWQDLVTTLEEVPAIAAALETAIEEAQDAADLAIAAAVTANEAADAVTSEQSIVSSFVKGFAGNSPLEADSAGNVTVKNQIRQYGDTALNPDVPITGSVLATGAAVGAIVRVYYDDPTRADTTPTFLFTVDPAAEPVQGGDRHVIGAVEIPAAGTSDGGYVRPPGYTGVTP